MATQLQGIQVYTDAEYGAELRIVSKDIEGAVILHHTREEINRLALVDGAILRVLNEEAQFWKTQVHSLQATLFITMARIFDKAPKGHSIHRLLNNTIGHSEFFSEQALAARKTGYGPEPDWLKSFLRGIWVPHTASDLRHLKRSLSPHAARFTNLYEPIRHAIYGHRLMSDDQAGNDLFPNTNRLEVGSILDFLHDLVDTIQDLYVNGNSPILGRRSYVESNARIRNGTENVLRKLARRENSANQS